MLYETVQAPHSEQTYQALGAANHALSPNAISVAAELKYSLGMPGQSHVSSMNNLRVASQLQSYPSHIAYVYLELHL
ncbi:MAG: hypothetical protein NTY42_22580 [Planctomycetota bacterium]|nr:hypothetical protein [Planctomycetota bacterium]